MGKGGENNYFEGPGQDKYKLESQAPDRDWQPVEGSVAKLRPISSLCVGVMRHWGMQGGKTGGWGSQPWNLEPGLASVDLNIGRCYSSLLTLRFSPIVRNKSTQEAVSRGKGKGGENGDIMDRIQAQILFEPVHDT